MLNMHYFNYAQRVILLIFLGLLQRVVAMWRDLFPLFSSSFFISNASLFTLLFSLFEKPEVFHPDENPEDSVSNRDFLILISFVFSLNLFP